MGTLAVNKLFISETQVGISTFLSTNYQFITKQTQLTWNFLVTYTTYWQNNHFTSVKLLFCHLQRFMALYQALH